MFCPQTGATNYHAPLQLFYKVLRTFLLKKFVKKIIFSLRNIAHFIIIVTTPGSYDQEKENMTLLSIFRIEATL